MEQEVVKFASLAPRVESSSACVEALEDHNEKMENCACSTLQGITISAAMHSWMTDDKSP